MPLRRMTRPRPPAETRTEYRDELVELRIREGRIIAVWSIENGRGRRRRAEVVVSPELAASIMQRAAFGNVLDNIRDDTRARAREQAGT